MQGALTSLVALAGIVGPPLATELFAHFTRPEASVQIPGIAFYMAAALSLVGLLLAIRAFRALPAQEEAVTA